MSATIRAATPPRLEGVELPFERAVVMGVLNLTPDSFSDGGRFARPEEAIAEALAMVEAGADILDLGGESTRPGSAPVSPEVQLARIMPVLADLGPRYQGSRVALSVDTTSAEVARRAIDAGASIINDISAFRFDPAMLPLLAETRVAAIAMHTTDRPAAMQHNLLQGDPVEAVKAHLGARLLACEAAGVSPARIIVDPGIGFGKDAAQNLQLLRGIPALVGLGRPLLIGVSRKRFIGDITGRPVQDRLLGTAAAVSLSRALGAHILRVHDVAAIRDVLRVTDAILTFPTAEGPP